MSTVNDDITKEIEELLKKKDPKQQYSYQASQISQGGKLNQSRGAIAYDGNINTLSKIVINQVPIRLAQSATMVPWILIKYMIVMKQD